MKSDNNTLTNTAHSREPFHYGSLRTLCCWEGPESHSRLHHVQSGALGPTWSCDKRFITFLLTNMKYYDSASGKKIFQLVRW